MPVQHFPSEDNFFLTVFVPLYTTGEDRFESIRGKAMDGFEDHLAAIGGPSPGTEHEEATATPIFTSQVFQHILSTSDANVGEPLGQYGLIGGLMEYLSPKKAKDVIDATQDPRLFVNLSHPLSTFICGSQGSGKSHTLSCLLEACLIPSSLNRLPKPLTALIFHYDTFISDLGGSPCEAAFLASNSAVKVRVLCSPTNLTTIRRTYAALNVTVEPLRLGETDLNTKRMLDLMAFRQEDGPSPLYIQTVMRILREMRIQQQKSGALFSYSDFKECLMNSGLTSAQLAPLQQRLETLESFMAVPNRRLNSKKSRKVGTEGITDWSPKPGSLTIIDLSCPCITSETACLMFNVCLSIFLEQDLVSGRVLALDEAHKYMNASAEASMFTEALLATIRLQRHLGARIFISTQEPTISSKLLDLSSVIIVHRFTSPQWLKTLSQHVAPVASNLALKPGHEVSRAHEEASGDELISSQRTIQGVFHDIVKLRVGEALFFSPNSMVGVRAKDSNPILRLGFGYVKVKIRQRQTDDGGKSLLAV